MSDDELTAQQAAAITASVDIEALPPDAELVALVLFGTNQAAPVQIAADRHRNGTAPLVITTGGVNRHNGIIEGREFARQLTEAGVSDSVIRIEDQSSNTWQNVELSLPCLREALAMGLRLAVVSKWYHLRAVYCLHTLVPEAVPFYAISWEPVYAGALVTRESWPKIPDGRRRVIRESEEVPRRVADGSYRPARKANGAWRLSCGPLNADAVVETRRLEPGRIAGGLSSTLCVSFLVSLARACAVVSACSGWCSSLAGVLPVPVCCRAERGAGGRRPTILVLTLTLTLIFGCGVRGACLCCQVVEPFLTSPPRVFLDGGVRSGTAEPASRRVIVLAGPANAPGLGCTVAARRVGGLCACCAGAVRAGVGERRRRAVIAVRGRGWRRPRAGSYRRGTRG
jgi:DUF218 domain